MINSNTKENFVIQFRNLSHENQQVRNFANHFLMRIVESQQAWTIAKELLDQPNNQYKFFGAQILYMKVQAAFQQMAIQWKTQLKTYVYNYFYQNCPNLSKPVLSKITGSAAIIACSLFLDNWKDFLNDLSKIMGTSLNHLKGGLQILQNLTEQIKNLKHQPYSYRQLIKKQFLRQQILLFNIFNSVFSTNDYSCIQKNLICIQNWTDFSLPIIKNAQLIPNIIMIALNSLQYFSLSCDILESAMKYHSLTNFSTLQNPLVRKQQLSKNEIANLILIVKFILQNYKNLYNQKMTYKSDYYQIFGRLVRQVLLNFPWIIIQDIQNVGIPLFNIMISTLKHKSLKVSYQALQFWNVIYNEIKKVKDQQVNKFIYYYYISAYEILLQKNKLKKIQTYVINESNQQQQQQKSEDDGQEISNGQKYNNKITFKEYREDSTHVFQVIYNVLFDKQGDEGIKTFFSYINKLLQIPFQIIQRQSIIELALYVIKSVCSGLNGNYLPYLHNILNHITTLHNVTNTVKTQIFKIFNDYIADIQQLGLFSNTLSYILRYILDVQIGQSAGYSFSILMKSLTAHNDSGLLGSFLQFYMQNFEKIQNEILMQKFINGFLSFLFKTNNYDLLDEYLKAFLSFSINQFDKRLQQKNSHQIMRCLKQLKIIFSYLQVEQYNYKIIIQNYCVDFAYQHLQYLLKTFNYCFNANLKFSQINQLGIIQNIYKSIIKLLKKVSHELIAAFLDTTIKFIAKDIKQYSNLMGLITHTIEDITSKKQTFQYCQNKIFLDQWLSKNYYQFNTFCINQLQTINDPDIIKNFYRIQEKILYYDNQQIFFKYQFHPQIIKIALYNLAYIYQTYMTKSLLLFILSFVNAQNSQIYKHYFYILEIVLTTSPKVQSSNNGTISKIMIKIAKYIIQNIQNNNNNYVINQQSLQNQLSLQNILYNLLIRCDFTEVSANNIKLLAHALQYYLITANEQLLKVSLMDVSSLSKGSYGNDIFLQIQMRLASAKKQNRLKSK